MVNSVESAVIIIFLVFTFAFRAVGVVGESMLPTLSNGDWLAVTSYKSSYDRNDIIIITQPNALDEPLVKRIIAVGGDTIDIDFDEHIVYVNGKPVSESFIREPTSYRGDVSFPLSVPVGYVFVMGDNRNNSLDSRSEIIGLINEKYILGKAQYRVFPFSGFKIS
ncbi:MAG: signal peptidase I [Clostridiales bacterium]|nr:signal peptidase I [Clostridiales bacterium]